MKSLILLAAILTAHVPALAVGPCFKEASAAAEKSFNAHIDDIPQARSPEGLKPVVANGNKLLSFQTTGIYFTEVPYGYSYKVLATVDVRTDESCRVVSTQITEKYLDVEGPQDEPAGDLGCEFEVGFICREGQVDRCGVYPEAETHQCAPRP